MCAYGMNDPNGYYYYKPTSLLHSFPDGTLDPVFKKVSKQNPRGCVSHPPAARGISARTWKSDQTCTGVSLSFLFTAYS